MEPSVHEFKAVKLASLEPKHYHSADCRHGAIFFSSLLIKLNETNPNAASEITVTKSLGLSHVSEASRNR
jgi:hypothetical protein